jgi:DNA polymerase-3 subunit delta'
LFSGNELGSLESTAQTLSKTLNCENPVRRNGSAVDCCDKCASCRKSEHGNHPDLHWVRPESKSRIIRVAQMRELIREIHLKPKESTYKVAVIVAADRLRIEGANAFLKTLEEPPADSVLVLLTTDPQRVLETMVSRCLRLGFGSGSPSGLDPGQQEWLNSFSDLAGGEHKSLMSRYRLLDTLLGKLVAIRASLEESLAARSPIHQYQDAEKGLVERWEEELTAAIEAEYRRQRADLLGVLHWWLRDVWLRSLDLTSRKTSGSLKGDFQNSAGSLYSFPELAATARVAQRLSPAEALDNLQILDQLQRWLSGNVQEALALEVGLLKLHL